MADRSRYRGALRASRRCPRDCQNARRIRLGEGYILGITRVRVPGELQRDHLSAPIERVTGWDTPYPHAQEWDYFPGPARVGKALKRVMEA